MNRIFRTITLIFLLISSVFVLSCSGKTETKYKLIIIEQCKISHASDFTGYFLLNNNYYNFLSVGTWDTTVTGTNYYYVILTDITKESKLDSLIVSATGTADTTSVEYYLYKEKGDTTTLVDSATDSPGYAGDIPKISVTYNF
jgi:hypothetical protein